jgi:hypothetical protein
MSVTCRKTKAKNIHPEYVFVIAFPRQQQLYERVSVIRYTYIACVFCNRDRMCLLRGTN